jgi:predicted MPP superfamily phosphohydrolase
MNKISRRTFLARAGIGGAACTGYAGVLEPQWLEINRHEVKTNFSGPPVKILHLSDFHASWCVNLAYIGQAIQCGLALKPDLILVTGDFITGRFGDQASYRRVLSQLPAAAPTFATLGNHDGGFWSAQQGGYPTSDWTRQLLAQSGLELLHNRSKDVRVNGRDLRLVGLGDLYEGEIMPQEAFPKAGPGPQPYCIALSHNPDTKDILRPYPWDLLLCGHTHGGQVWLPIIGAPFAPVADKRYLAGMYRWDKRWMHITKGVGNMWGLRFNCRPEVSLLTLA